MPNHRHGIIELTHVNQTVDDSDVETPPVGTRHVVSSNDVPPHIRTRHVVSLHDGYQKNAFGKHISVSVIMQQYKSSVKRWCNKNECHYFQWQPRFYDHIIRDFQSYQYISNYIVNNPEQWNNDKFFQ